MWGTSSSARSLIFADGVPLTALIANNNTIGGPRWGLVAPAEIERIDMMMGPFSAAYAGNSMGAVMEITTRLPEKLEGSIKQTQALQTFDLYGTQQDASARRRPTREPRRSVRQARVLGERELPEEPQPAARYVTSASIPDRHDGRVSREEQARRAGERARRERAAATPHMTNAKIKAAYDITPTLRAAYTFGYWRNDANGGVEPYIDARRGSRPTRARRASRAAPTSSISDTPRRALSLRTDRKRDWDLELVGSTYRFDNDQQRSPTSAASTGDTFGTNGRVAVLDGTGWATLDLKGTWKPFGQLSTHTLSSGVHDERYSLKNPTYNTSRWTDGGSRTAVFTRRRREDGDEGALGAGRVVHHAGPQAHGRRPL